MSRKTGSLSSINNGVYVSGLSNREDLHQAGWTLTDKYLSREEARNLAEAISKLE